MTDLLLDTSVAIWLLEGDDRAWGLIGEELATASTSVSVSVVSWIEIAIKHGQGKLQHEVALVRAALVGNGARELAIDAGHALRLERLPLLHRDPFDRLLIAQAQAEGMTLVTTDQAIGRYRDLVDLRGV